jgi:casein kinase II subunit alpha
MLLPLLHVLSSSRDGSGFSSDGVLDASDLYETYPITYLNASSLELLDEIGSGRFSWVHRARLPDGRVIAAKRLKPAESWRLKREVKFLEMLRGCPHVLEFIGVYGDELDPIIATELAPHDTAARVALSDVRWAMRCLLGALNATHARRAFHRDVKWANVLMSFRERSFRLIDWGLAELVIPGRPLGPRTGTKCYKAPELLLGWRDYGPPVDVWAAGVSMANLMFGRHCFFAAGNDRGVLTRHAQLFGHARIAKIARQIGYEGHVPFYLKRSFLEFALPDTRALFTSDAIDLLERLLTPEVRDRITAGEALLHPFFRARG